MTMVVTIASGEAKVGKSVIGANLSQYLNQKGHRTGFVVAGSRQPVWGIEPDSHWPDVLDGRLSLDKIIHRDVFGVDLMVAQPCANNLQGLCALDLSIPNGALEALEAYTYLIIDCATGISAPMLACGLAADATVLILTPDTAALTTSFEWLVHLARHDFRGPVHIVLNQAASPAQARSIYLRFRDQVQNRLGLRTDFWGSLKKVPIINPQDLERYPLSQSMPRSDLLRNIRVIGDRLVEELPPGEPGKPIIAFWQNFLEYLRQRATDPQGPGERPPVVLEDLPAVKESHPPRMEDAREMAWLNTHLTNIAHDLQAIRRLLEAGSEPGALPGIDPEALSSHKETLDFETFMMQHRKPEEK